ncbi:MAG: dTDP-4-dehydrorhamnose reductase [Planctomycetaceae bacterium]|nr:dTDP-4-dehydrorhamnose reductase [Planctomycetaceae bacterium]
MKIAVTGAAGQLGYELVRQLGAAAIALDRAACDLADPASIRRLVAWRPDAVINAAAYTQVDKAEQERELCRRINATAVGELAEICAELDCPLVQVSTDYVFAGQSGRSVPFAETDPAAPRGVYATTKYEGELLAAQCPKHWIVRTCGLHAAPAPGRRFTNFVATMLRLGTERDHLRIVDDQRCTPSYVPHVARAILSLLRESPQQLRGTGYGLYHVTNRGDCTWYEFAAEIFRQAQIKIELTRITTAEFGAAAPRPSYSVLDLAKYQALGGPELPDWREGVRAHLECVRSGTTG